jgi:ribosomal protein S18 acetylase RimI-like enzyme
MPVIRATEKHFMDVMFLLRRCVEDMNSKGMFHWNRSYPSPGTIFEDIRNGTLHIFSETGICKGMIVFDESVGERYRRMDWKTRQGKVLVVHRLAVSPVFQATGIGRQLVEFALHHARNNGYSAVWLDVIDSNRQANEQYLEMGFRKTGSFHFPFQESPFNCYEISLDE